MVKLIKSRAVTLIVSNPTVHMVTVTLSRDGVGIKPGLEYDPIRKLLDGPSNDIDLEGQSNTRPQAFETHHDKRC